MSVFRVPLGQLLHLKKHEGKEMPGFIRFKFLQDRFKSIIIGHLFPFEDSYRRCQKTWTRTLQLLEDTKGERCLLVLLLVS